MPVTTNEKEIAIYIGIFDGSDNTFTWKKDSKYTTINAAVKSFKSLCSKCVAYDYEELVKIYGTPRLDISLKIGAKQIKWVGIYQKQTEDEE